MSKIIDRTGKGSAIAQSEFDANYDSLHGINQAIAGTTHTVDITDQGDTLEFTSATAVAVTLDSIATIAAALHTSDFKVTLIAIGAGAVTITPDGLNTINTGAGTIVLAQNEYVTIQTDSTGLIWNIIDSSDASKVDGLDASQFLRSDANDTATGNITFSGDSTFNGQVDLDGLIFIGGSGMLATAAELNKLDGATVSTAEINNIDGGTSATATTSVGADRVVYNDAGVMKQVALTDLDTYFSATTKTLTNKTINSGAFTGTQTGFAGDVTGDLTGNADTVTTNANLTGDVTSVGNATTLARPMTVSPIHATTSSTTATITGIPSWAKKITININRISTDGTSAYLLRIGDSGGSETSGYISAASDGTTVTSSTAGFLITGTLPVDAGGTAQGAVILTKSSTVTNLWSSTGTIHTQRTGTNKINTSSGDKTLTAALDRISLTTVSGDTFDDGSINIVYKG